MMMCAVAPDMAGPTRAYLAERAEKVRVAGMRGVAEASLANSFPTSRPEARAAYRGIYLGNDPAAHAKIVAGPRARREMTAADWGAIRAPVGAPAQDDAAPTARSCERPQRSADHVHGGCKVQRPQQSVEIVRNVGHRERPGRFFGSPGATHVDRNHPAVRRQKRDDRAPAFAAPPEFVQQQHRRSARCRHLRKTD
jgi:hypothetical protein